MKFSRGHATEGDLDATVFNSIASTILKMAEVRSSYENAKLAPVNVEA
jgi:hypothetical protein